MELTREEERILGGNKGEGAEKAMEILLSIGELNDAPRLIPVKRVQIAGVSYKTIGDAGLDFIRDLAESGARVSTFATLNPAGVDLGADNTLVPKRFRDKQTEILEAYKKMGATPSCTCTPYLAGNKPGLDEHIAFAESSAVAYTNSVLGARTNRESAITALASAITGKTPYYGLHLEENRLPTVQIDVEAEPVGSMDYSILGYHVGKHVDGIPLFTGIDPSPEDYKALSAGLATGKITMFHVLGKTPNKTVGSKKLERVNYSAEDKLAVQGELNTCDDPDIICLGCPHYSLEEIKSLIELRPKKEVWVYTSRHVKEKAEGLIDNPNIKLISDTCMVVSPLEEMGIKSIGTNSTKCAYYSSTLSGQKIMFAGIKDLLG